MNLKQIGIHDLGKEEGKDWKTISRSGQAWTSEVVRGW